LPQYNGKTVAEWIELARSPDEDMRRQAVYALGQIGPGAREAVPALVKAVDDVKQEVRWYAVDALGRIGPDAEQAVPAIIAAAKDPANDRTFAQNAAKALGRIGPAAREAVPLLAEAVRQGAPVDRAAAALALWKIQGGAEPIAILTALLKQPDDGAFEACLAFAEMGPNAQIAAESLVAALAHPSADVRRAAARVLGDLGLPVVAVIVKALAEPDKIDRQSAAVAIGFIADQAREQILFDPQTTASEFSAAARTLLLAVRPLAGLLNDPHENVRLSAARSLAKMGPLSVPSLLEQLRSDDPLARQSAIEALARLEQYMPADDETPAAIEHIKKQIAGSVIQTLKHDDFAVRAAAVRTLATLSIGSDAREATPILRDALKGDDPAIRRYALKALERIQGSP
jgi:HEAT repeat protein